MNTKNYWTVIAFIQQYISPMPSEHRMVKCSFLHHHWKPWLCILFVTSVFSAFTRTLLRALIWSLAKLILGELHTRLLGLAPEHNTHCVLEENRKRTCSHVPSRVICYFLPQPGGSSGIFLFLRGGGYLKAKEVLTLTEA